MERIMQQSSIHPLQVIFGILFMMLMLKGCVYAFDREMQINQEQNQAWAAAERAAERAAMIADKTHPKQ